jgi:hypothetical protein
MFELFNNIHAAAFSNTEPATVYTASKAVYGYNEVLNMEAAPFDYAPRAAKLARRPHAGKRKGGGRANNAYHG